MGMPIKNLEGMRFGRLVVLKLDKIREKHGGARWLCKCDCGKHKVIRARCLVEKMTRSCGCLQNEDRRLLRKGPATQSPTYRSWRAMLARCTNPNMKDAKNYVGRGIVVCDRWTMGENGIHPFYCFVEDMGERPFGRTLDRKNNNENYNPDNCRWATRKQQGRNKRPFSEEHKAAMRKPKSITYKHTPEWIAKRVKAYMKTCAKRKKIKMRR